MRVNQLFFLPVILLTLYSCKNNERLLKNETASTIYYGGDILTMDGDTANYVEAVAIKNGRIIFTGNKSEIENWKGDSTEMVDLKGKTLMPGFVEPHVHPSIAATMLPNEIISMNDWVLPNEVKKGVTGHKEYISRITESINKNVTDETPYLIWGYHQLWHGVLSKEILNKIAPNKPVGILHRSFHEIYINDAFIKKFNIKESDYTNNPQVNWAKGHFYEGGWLALVPKLGSVLFNPERTDKGMEMMSKLIQKNGITTICEPGFGTSDFDMEFAMLKKEMAKPQPYEAYLIPNGTQLYTSQKSNEAALAFTKTLGKFDTENIHFLPNQIKLFADGAIYSQAMQMVDGYTDGHKGEWMTPLDLLAKQMTLYWNAGYQLHIHANGDEGIQQVINFNKIDQKNNPRTNHRLTLHHMGYFSEKQAKDIASLNIEASVNPYYLWALADKYSTVGLGKSRAESLVRIKSLIDNKIPVSFHSDFSMAPLEPLTLAWTAVNRETSEGSKFSQSQCIDVYSAMKAITITAASAIQLEDKIGSIKKDKIANFTILAQNPMKVNPKTLKDIKVIATVYKGKYFEVN